MTDLSIGALVIYFNITHYCVSWLSLSSCPVHFESLLMLPVSKSCVYCSRCHLFDKFLDNYLKK